MLHGFTLDGIGTATFGAIILHQVLGGADAQLDSRSRLDPTGAADG